MPTLVDHKRPGKDHLTEHSDSVYARLTAKDTWTDMRHHTSPNCSLMNWIQGSPHSKKGSNAGVDNPAIVSGAENENGSCSETETRHAQPSVVEHSLGCRSGFSDLLERLTKKSHSNIDGGMLDAARQPWGSRNCLNWKMLEDGKTEIDQGDIRRFKINLTRSAEGMVNTNVFDLCSVQPGLGLSEIGNQQIINRFLEKISDCGKSANCQDPVSDIPETPIVSRMFPAHNGHVLTECAQIKDQERAQTLDFTFLQNKDSLADEPIDYSQRSSRWKKINIIAGQTNEVNTSSPVDVKTGSTFSSRNMPAEMDSDKTSTKNVFQSSTLTPKCHREPSPNNDNLAPFKSYQTIHMLSDSNHRNTFPLKHTAPSANRPNNSLTYPKNGDTQMYPDKSPQSPQSFNSGSPDDKIKDDSERAKTNVDPIICAVNSSEINKAQVSYHPKLKYLFIASLASKSNEPALPKTTNCDNTLSSNKQNSIKWREEKAGVNKAVKLNRRDNKVFLKSRSAKQRLLSANTAKLIHNELYIFKQNKTDMAVENEIYNVNTRLPLINDEQTMNSDIYKRTPCVSLANRKFDQSKQKETKELVSQLQIPPLTNTSNSHPCTTPSSTVSFLCKHIFEMDINSRSSDAPQSRQTFPCAYTSISNHLKASTQQNNSSISDNACNSIYQTSSIKSYDCADCGKRYATLDSLTRHCQSHKIVANKTARKCPNCDKIYYSVSAYSMHLKTHRLVCECPYCGKKCSRHWLLQGHIRTHTGEKPFPCPRCGKSFADKSNLRAHIQTHSPDKPFVCGRCKKAFSLKSYLHKHEDSACLGGRRKSR